MSNGRRSCLRRARHYHEGTQLRHPEDFFTFGARPGSHFIFRCFVNECFFLFAVVSSESQQQQQQQQQDRPIPVYPWHCLVPFLTNVQPATASDAPAPHQSTPSSVENPATAAMLVTSQGAGVSVTTASHGTASTTVTSEHEGLVGQGTSLLPSSFISRPRTEGDCGATSKG